jgi:hypothetical protein
MLAVGAFVFTQQRAARQQRDQAQAVAPAAADSQGPSADDVELLSHVSPSARAAYADDLKTVNSFIRDAEDSVAQDPDDDEARHFLMQAYQERDMVYASAMDRSTP